MSKPRSSYYEEKAEKEIDDDEATKGSPSPPPLYPPFQKAIDSVIETIRSKNADYANAQDPFSNFIESAKSADIEVWQSFEQLIGIKEARLRNLQGTQTKPNNESITDTYKDRAVYAVLAYAYRLREEEPKPGQFVPVDKAKYEDMRGSLSYRDSK